MPPGAEEPAPVEPPGAEGNPGSPDPPGVAVECEVCAAAARPWASEPIAALPGTGSPTVRGDDWPAGPVSSPTRLPRVRVASTTPVGAP